MQSKTLLPLPPLSFEVLWKIDDIEEYARASLEACSDPDNLSFNTEHAVRLLRTCVVTMLDLQIDYFSSLPHYQSEWIDEVAQKAIDSLIAAFPPFKSGEEFRFELRCTVNDHLARRPETIENGAAKAAPSKPASSDRKALRDSYLANFPDERIKIVDMCWAAGQHKREWKRWLKGDVKVKDGGTADLAFRRFLASGKRPEEYNTKPRPPGWE
jgi:hypothetical protein